MAARVSGAPESNRLLISTADKRGEKSYVVDGVLFTGPGTIRKIAANYLEGDDYIDGKRYWALIPLFKELSGGKIAVIGGGETAASVTISILENNPELTVEVINPSGALFSRGESFFENQLFSSGEGWSERGVETRREIIRRTDQGVFSVEAMNHLAQSQNARFRGGRVTSIRRTQNGIEVRFAGEEREEIYEKVIMATGFDNWKTLDLLDPELQPKEEDREGLLLKIDSHLRLPIPAKDVNIHVPMLSGLSQGPGFPNLSCLGLLADRILSTYVQ